MSADFLPSIGPSRKTPLDGLSNSGQKGNKSNKVSECTLPIIEPCSNRSSRPPSSLEDRVKLPPVSRPSSADVKPKHTTVTRKTSYGDHKRSDGQTNRLAVSCAKGEIHRTLPRSSTSSSSPTADDSSPSPENHLSPTHEEKERSSAQKKLTRSLSSLMTEERLLQELEKSQAANRRKSTNK